MEYWASSESDLAIHPALTNVRLLVGSFLNIEFAKSSLSTIDAKLRYVPIVMHDKWKGNYPPRSKLLKKKRIYDCAPQLSYDIFLDGSLEEQLAEYLRGLAESAPYLAEFGATPDQIDEFHQILVNCVFSILEKEC